MAEFMYKGFLISVRRAKSGAGWDATATVPRSPQDREVAFDTHAEGIADLVHKIEASIHERRAPLALEDDSSTSGRRLL